jgi:hypothetical protein
MRKTYMKKIILSSLAVFFGVALFASSAHAQAVFNNPGEMPTVTVSSNTCTQGPINGCWRTHTTANADGTVGVNVFYHNTSNTAAQGTTISMSPQVQGPTTSATFSGSIKASNASTVSGTATVTISSSQTLTFVDAKWYPGVGSSGSAVSGSALFGSGFNIGTVPADGSGSLVARFRVSNNTVNPTYQCNDGIDNDSDGKVDYPTDPGCSSSTDNDEYNSVVQAECVIDSFYASPTTVASGGYTTLYWNTTNCDNVTIDWVTYPVDGSGSFGPLYSGKNYELRATRSAMTQTRNIYVSVTQVNPTYACNDGIDNDSDGRVDYPNDAGCYGPTDNDEYNQIIINPTYACNDGIDNDSDGRVDYPNDIGCTSFTDDSEYNQVINIQPQAITTVPSGVTTTSVRLNGIAVPNSTYSTTAWFEWGTSGALGSRTTGQPANSTNSTYYSESLSGLVPGGVYYYRAVVQNQNGTAYGETVRFQTLRPTVATPPTVITRVVRVPTSTVVTTNSAPSLLELRVENVYDRMCVGGEMDYTVTYRNISGQTLQNAVLRITHPKELTFINSSRGDYEVVDRTVTISLGDIRAGEQGVVQVRARVNSEAITGNLAVTTATVVYTNTITRAQEDAIAYSLITVSSDCPNVLGASAFGIGSFFPSTLVGWLLLILIILALIVITRQIYRKREQV